MPWEPLGHLTDDDLEAIFTYLQSIPPIKKQGNRCEEIDFRQLSS